MPIYEVHDGDALEAIESQCRHLSTINGFSNTTHPTLDEVSRFRDMAYYKVAGLLSATGYNVVQTSENALGWLESLQVLETIIMIELAYPISGAGQPNARFAEFCNQRDRMVNMLLEHMELLSSMGAEKAKSLGQFAEFTGTSRSRKDSVNTDSDLIPPRFSRAWGQRPDEPIHGAPSVLGEDDTFLG